MSNIHLSSDMERIFLDNIQIESYTEKINNLGITYNYIHGFLTTENLQSFYITSDYFMNSWISLAKNVTSHKFDIGKYKGVYPINYTLKPNFERNVNVLNIEFSIDYINQYSDISDNILPSKRIKKKLIKKEYFEKGLFEI